MLEKKVTYFLNLSFYLATSNQTNLLNKNAYILHGYLYPFQNYLLERFKLIGSWGEVALEVSASKSDNKVYQDLKQRRLKSIPWDAW